MKLKTSVCWLSSSFSIPRPITYFHSTIKNLTLLHSIWNFQSQGPLHVFIVCQKPHFTTLSFSFSIPRPITCFHSMTKTSLCCAQFQFLNPRSHNMYPMAYKLLNSFQPSMQRPHIKFMWESTFQGHVDHCGCDMWYNVHSHCNVHTIYFQCSTQTLSHWAHNFPLNIPMISYWPKNYYTKSHGNIQGAFDFMLLTPTAISTLLIFHGAPKILSCWAPIMSHWAHNLPLSAPIISYCDKIHYTKSHGNIQEAFKFMLFTPTAICTPLIYYGPPNILSC